MPSTLPTTVMWTPVMPSPGWKPTSAFVSSACGGVPALASTLDSAIEKHAECAAAISSSGLVFPLGSSVRAGQETSYVPRPDDSRVTWPEPPSRRAPSQWVFAVRVVAMRSSFFFSGTLSGGSCPTLAGMGTIDK